MYKKKTDRYSFLQILKAEYKQNSNIRVNGNQNYEYYSDGRLIQYGVYIPTDISNRTDIVGTTGMANTDIYFKFPINFSNIDFVIAYPILTHSDIDGTGNYQYHQHVLPGVLCGNNIGKNTQVISVARNQSITLTTANIYVACYAVGHV